jgi:hypothetical protein
MVEHTSAHAASLLRFETLIILFRRKTPSFKTGI